MKKTAMLLTLAILLCICSCLSARALEDTRTSQLLVGSVLGDESEKCYFYSSTRGIEGGDCWLLLPRCASLHFRVWSRMVSGFSIYGRIYENVASEHI